MHRVDYLSTHNHHSNLPRHHFPHASSFPFQAIPYATSSQVHCFFFQQRGRQSDSFTLHHEFVLCPDLLGLFLTESRVLRGKRAKGRGDAAMLVGSWWLGVEVLLFWRLNDVESWGRKKS